jgi:hypothetical protein
VFCSVVQKYVTTVEINCDKNMQCTFTLAL